MGHRGLLREQSHYNRKSIGIRLFQFARLVPILAVSDRGEAKWRGGNEQPQELDYSLAFLKAPESTECAISPADIAFMKNDVFISEAAALEFAEGRYEILRVVVTAEDRDDDDERTATAGGRSVVATFVAEGNVLAGLDGRVRLRAALLRQRRRRSGGGRW